MWSRTLVLLLLVLILRVASARAQPGAAPVEPVLELIFAAELQGAWSPRQCDEDLGEGPARGGLLGLAQAIARARQSGRPSLVVGGGALLGPGNLARYLLGSEAGSRHAARLLRRAGIEVVSPGVAELAIAREPLLSYLDELAEAGPPPVLSNLTCPADNRLCRRTRRQLVLHRGGLTVGVLGTLPEDTERRVGPGHLHEAQVAPRARLLAQARALRAQVDLLVLSLDLGPALGLAEAIALARELAAEGARADVVQVLRQNDPRGGLEALQLSEGTLLIGAPVLGAGVTVVAVRRSLAGGRLRFLKEARRVAPGPEPAAIDPELAGLLEAARADMCRGWGQAVAELPPRGLPRERFTRLVLDGMREGAQAEVALINSKAIADAGLPLRSASREALGQALPFAAAVVRGRVSGRDLEAALRPHLQEDPALRVLGVSRRADGALLVNGRPLLPTARYRVVTIDFVAAGGDRLLPPALLRDARRIGPAGSDLRALLLELLARRGAELLRPVPLEERSLWSANVDLGVDLQGVSVSNPSTSAGSADGASRPVYDRPLLTRSNSVALRLDLNARLEMDRPAHLLQVSFKGQYGQTRVSVAAAGTTPAQERWQETVDLVTLQGMYSYRAFAVRSPRLPTPYFAAGLETEVNRPEAVRRYHHLELSGALGARLALPGRVSANLGLGLRGELLADPDRRAEPALRNDSGAVLRAELTSDAAQLERSLARPRLLVQLQLERPKAPLWTRWGVALLGEGALTYSFTDPSLLRTHELRATGKLYLELVRPLYLTVGMELYLYSNSNPRTQQQETPGAAVDLSAGLKVALDGRHQTF